MPRRRIPEVKARLLVAIGDRIEHSANALKKLAEPHDPSNNQWVESMQLHYAATCDALLNMFACIEEMPWTRKDDNEQKLQECMQEFRQAAERAAANATENHRLAPSEETQAEAFAQAKALAAVNWVWDLIYPGDARSNTEERSNGEASTTETRADAV